MAEPKIVAVLGAEVVAANVGDEGKNVTQKAP